MKIIKIALTLLIGFTVMFILLIPLVYIGNSDPRLDTSLEVAFKLTISSLLIMGSIGNIIFILSKIFNYINENN